MLNCVLLIRFFDSLPPKFPKIFFHSLLAVRWLVCQLVPFLSSSPKGVDDQSFHTYGEFFPFWAAAPKGTKSCRTQGDFCSSVCSFVHLFVCSSPPSGPSDLKSALWDLRFGLSGLKSNFSGLKPGLSGLKLGFSGLKFKFSGLKPGLKPGLSGLKSAIWASI